MSCGNSWKKIQLILLVRDEVWSRVVLEWERSTESICNRTRHAHEHKEHMLFVGRDQLSAGVAKQYSEGWKADLQHRGFLVANRPCFPINNNRLVT